VILTSHQDSTGSNCQNCGWGSHCGTARYAEVRERNTDYEPYQIKVCSSCRCEKCSNVDK
jgi:hypothetical protein